MRTIHDANVGDTLSSPSAPQPALPGFRRPQPMVFAGLFPLTESGFEPLQEAMGKFLLKDGSVTVAPEHSASLGRGLRCGFLGMLHMEVHMHMHMPCTCHTRHAAHGGGAIHTGTAAMRTHMAHARPRAAPRLPGGTLHTGTVRSHRHGTALPRLAQGQRTDVHIHTHAHAAGGAAAAAARAQHRRARHSAHGTPPGHSQGRDGAPCERGCERGCEDGTARALPQKRATRATPAAYHSPRLAAGVAHAHAHAHTHADARAARRRRSRSCRQRRSPPAMRLAH